MSKTRMGMIIDDCPQSKFIWDFVKKINTKGRFIYD